MMKKGFVLLVVGAFLLAGCGGGGGGVKSAGQTAETTAAAAYDTNMIQEEGVWEEDLIQETAAEAPADSGDLTSASGIDQAVSPARKLIRNVHMSVETDSFDNLIGQLQSKVTELAGYIEQSDISGSSITYNNVRPNRYASITARIPADKLNQFIAVVEGNGNVTNKSESAQDITLQYSDLESRKKTLTVEQERIWSLLEKADTLEAVIVLEERLSEIRYELESMEARLKLFDNQVEYSTVEISVHEVLPVDFTPVAPETVSQRIKKGFSKNVENVSKTFTNLFVGIVSGIPVWLPLAAAILLIAVIAKHIFRKNRKAVSPDSTDSAKES